MAEPIKIRRALISVYDKTGIVEFARALRAEFGTEIISTGGTAKVLAEAGIPVTLVETITGFPEILGGRVKTLHPAIFAAILADRDNPEHMRQLAERGIEPIDVVVVHLYPFDETVADPACTFERAIEMIDVGGVALLRAGAKNHRHVLVPPFPDDLERLLVRLRDDALSDEGWATVRRDYAASALELASRYDAAIAAWLTRGARSALHLQTVEELRYGENAHQAATVRQTAQAARQGGGLPRADSGCTASVAMSYNNYLDADSALALCAELTRAGPALLRERPMAGPTLTGNRPIPTLNCVFIKHTNPCGVGIAAAPPEARSTAQVEAYRRAYLGDPNAAMGGVLACSFEVDAGFAAVVMDTYERFGRPLKAVGAAHAPGGFFVEVWLAPRFTDDAIALIRGTYDSAAARMEPGEARIACPPRKNWGQNVRLLAVGDMSAEPDPREMVYRSIAGGMLVQTPDLVGLNEEQWKVVTKRAPTEREMADLRLAWLICKHTRSNAVTLVQDGMLLGSGAGQMSRVMSCRVAVWLAQDNGHLKAQDGRQRAPGTEQESGKRRDGPVAASDAFFPFRDGPDLLLDAGVTAIIQPGGSKRDAETIAACDERGATMIFTGTRHFRH